MDKKSSPEAAHDSDAPDQGSQDAADPTTSALRERISSVLWVLIPLLLGALAIVAVLRLITALFE